MGSLLQWGIPKFFFSFLFSQVNSFLDKVEEALNTLLRVIIAGNGICDHVGVTVSVNKTHGWYSNFTTVNNSPSIKVERIVVIFIKIQ